MFFRTSVRFYQSSPRRTSEVVIACVLNLAD